MLEHLSSRAPVSRRKPLATCVASVFALVAPACTLAASVANCLDDGTAGTLRSVIAAAASGDTVDLSALSCSTITLDSAKGYLYVAQPSLTIKGPAASTLTIDGSALYTGSIDYSYVIFHGGNGTLEIDHLTISGGHPRHHSAFASGGCIYSNANVYLSYATVSSCTVYSEYQVARGAGVFTAGDLTLSHSTISGNTASGADPRGGGAYVQGKLTLKNSTVTQNGASGATARGGGVYVIGDLSVQASTISYGSASSTLTSITRGGGAYVKGNLTVQDGSTISYNTATADAGDALGGGAFVLGNTSMVLGTGKYNFFLHNSATSSSGAAKGGGAFSGGTFSAGPRSAILYGYATSTTGNALGGGVYAVGDFSLSTGFLSLNSAKGSFSEGGGVFAKNGTSTSYSSIKYNAVKGLAGNCLGGGMYLTGATNTIASSTIAQNSSCGNIGGVGVVGHGTGVTFELKNSTVSTNSAAGVVGGLYADSANVKVWNSTIAFNTAGLFVGGNSPGAVLSAFSNAMAANVQSTLMSDNSYGASIQNDFSTYPTNTSVTFNGGALSVHANNLVRATNVTNLPTDTLNGACPLLGPLRYNGGPFLMLTHAIQSHSPAIDAGNDSSLLALYDQRGSAAVNGSIDFTRYSGTASLTDIGAYEVQQNDIVFDTSFETCVPL